MKKIIVIILILTGCTGPSKYDLKQNEVIMELVNAHNTMVAKVYPTAVPEVKK